PPAPPPADSAAEAAAPAAPSAAAVAPSGSPVVPASAAAASAPGTSAGDVDELALETDDLAALRAEAKADPARAAAHADASARRFPHGTFGIEREAIAIDALARSGRRADARARAEAFLAAHPKSTFAEEVRRAGGLE
ncbi:MAG TPA: hypothetical protein VHB21_15590, partial [Minicystis sp.]|nr:hypothetical protein [Minicystis sp.]